MRPWVKAIAVAGFVALGTSCSGGPVSEPTQESSDLDSALRARGSASIMVHLGSEADLTPFARMSDAATRREATYRALAHHASVDQKPFLQWLAGETRGHVIYRSFHLLNAVVVDDAPAALIRKIRARTEVRRVTYDRPIKQHLPTPSTSDVGNETRALAGVAQSNIRATGADRVWSTFGAKGAGIVVAGQDTGISWTHPTLKSHYRGWNGTTADHSYSWHDAIRTGAGGNPCGYDIHAPCDDHGHGTHTMGSIVGSDGASNLIGMAPAAQWIGCRNMDEGSGRASTYLDCLEWFLAPYPQGGDPTTDGDTTKAPHVINNSWGCDASEGCVGTELIDAMRKLDAAGIMMVVSAGNEGPGCSTIGSQPATASELSLAVGAYSHTSGNIASFSSRGPSTLDNKIGPDVAAPGVSIRSAYGTRSYTSMSGTSMAGPHVAGLVALLWSADPTLKGQLVETTDVIRAAAKARTTSQSCAGVSGSARPNNTWGYGVIDAYATVASRVPVPPTP